MGKTDNKIDLVEVLKFLNQSGADSARLRAGAPPRFLRGAQEIASEFPAVRPDQIRPLIYAVLAPEQIRQYEDNGQLRMSFRLKAMGEFTLEAYYLKGAEEGIFRGSNPDRQESI